MDLSEIPADSSFRRHPWEEVRAEFFTEALGSVVATDSECSLLDAGSGDGWLAGHFVARYPQLHVTCFDPGYEDAGLPPAQDRLRFTPTFPDEIFDAATLLDVVEHVEDDVAFLADVRATCGPGGLVVSVPAWPQLFSRHDVALLHYRRYTPGALRAVLAEAGFEVLSGNGLFHSLLPPRWLSTARERSRHGEGPETSAGEHSLAWHGPEPLRRIAGTVLRADTRLTQLADRRGIALPRIERMGDLPQACLTLPCFNEAERLDLEAFRKFAAVNPTIRMVFVDDGSDDPTYSLISGLAAEYPDTVSALRSSEHLGKAGAVRIGLQAGIAEGAEVVGYLDADLATPLTEVPRLLEAVVPSGIDGALGSRVGLLGYDVQRTPMRHYMGRVFATVASRLLGLGATTLNGAKVFRVTPGLAASLEQPFESCWTFDVELLIRLRQNSPQSRFVEVPLHHWSDVPGSKLKLAAGLRAGVELLGLWRRNRSTAPTGGL